MTASWPVASTAMPRRVPKDEALSLVLTSETTVRAPLPGFTRSTLLNRRVSPMRRSITSSTTSSPVASTAIPCRLLPPGNPGRGAKGGSLLGVASERIVRAPLFGIHAHHPPPGITLCRPYIIYDDQLAGRLDGDAHGGAEGGTIASRGVGKDRARPTARIHAQHPLLIEHHELTRGLNGKAR